MLIVLDINGILCNKGPVKPEIKSETEVSEDVLAVLGKTLSTKGKIDIAKEFTVVNSKLETIELPRFTVTIRPHCREFLAFCFEKYDVGFFSSTTYPNANAILEKLLTKEQQKKVVFRWFRDHTHFDPDTRDSSTIKKLSDLWSNPSVNYDRRYSRYNTLMCDDSKVKVRFNEPANVVLFTSFADDVNDTELLERMKEIPKRFEQLLELELSDHLKNSSLEEKQEVEALFERWK